MDKRKRREEQKRKRALEKKEHKRKMEQRYGVEELQQVKGFRPGKGSVLRPCSSKDEELPPENPSFVTG